MPTSLPPGFTVAEGTVLTERVFMGISPHSFTVAKFSFSNFAPDWEISETDTYSPVKEGEKERREMFSPSMQTIFSGISEYIMPP